MRASVGLLLLLGFPTGASAAEYFMSPTGNDTRPGTRTSAWLTFGHALSQLEPGDTLTLLDGRYTVPVAGNFRVFCGSPHHLGLPFAPITVRADHERQAWLDGTGADTTVSLTGCSHWVIEGLRVSGDDVGTAFGAATVGVRSSDHVVLRRLLVHHSNRTGNFNLVDANDSSHVLLEECELYDFHRGGVGFWRTHASTVRRCFINSRNFPDIGGYTSSDPNRGDDGITIYERGWGLTVENTISEGQSVGINEYSFADRTLSAGRYLGDITVSTLYGVDALSSGSTSSAMPNGEQWVDFVAVSQGEAFFFQSVRHTHCLRCSAFSGADGVRAELDVISPGDGHTSIYVDDSLAVGGPTSVGFNLDIVAGGSTAWTQNSWAQGYAAPVMPTVGVGTVSVTADAGLGGCVAWVPPASPVARAGAGAQVLYRYEDGVLTSAPLWDPATGAFPCGVAVPGVNDDAGTDCIGVHQRLNVNTPSCPFPPGYPGPVAAGDAGYSVGRTFYVAPAGNDSAAGDSLATAWQSLPRAVQALQPGDTLLLADGHYTAAVNGRMLVNCSGTERSGLERAPISVRALNERAAFLDGNGTGLMLSFQWCMNWNVEGLVVTDIDTDVPAYGATTVVELSDSVTLRKMVWAHSNRVGGAPLVLIREATRVTVEDSELYDFVNTGLGLVSAVSSVVRRVYLHGRGAAPLDGGAPSAIGVVFVGGGADNVIENCVMEGVPRAGLYLWASSGLAGNRFVGDVVLGARSGVLMENFGPLAADMSYDNHFEDFVVLGSEWAFVVSSARATSCAHCTLQARSGGFLMAVSNEQGDGFYTAIVSDSLVLVPDGGAPLTLDSRSNAAYVDAWPAPAQPGGAYAIAMTHTDPQLGACNVFLPTTSPLKGQGSAGTDLGANVLYRSVGGKLTSQPLWEPSTGAFPCGARVTGLSDVAGASCFDVHQRLGIGGSCTLAYADGGTPDGGALDGGGADGGGADGGSADGGPVEGERRYVVGCGCGQGGAAFALLGVVSLLRRRLRSAPEKLLQ